ncbi:MAG: 50S ribosomal protein L7/L12 [Candidatus Peribacteria bacterium]|nr:MAG: 50S ribosomal protein L7/L12 [Candidatus Peribacteria bacterium]
MTDVTKNVQQIIDLIKELPVVELNSLVKALEEEFGVTAAAMVVAGGAAGGAAGGGDDEVASSNIELTEIGGQKIAVIKVVKELLNTGLKEAKEMVEKAPVIIKENASDDEIEAFKTKLEEAGATVSLK